MRLQQTTTRAGASPRRYDSRHTLLQLGRRLQRAAIEGDEAVFLRSHGVLLAPPAHDANRGFDGRAGHAGELLAREREGNEGAPSIGAAHLPGQLEKEAGEAGLDAGAAPSSSCRHTRYVAQASAGTG